MSYIDGVPIEKDASYEANWLSYISCLVSICAADGLSSTERAAIVDWMRGHGLPEALLDQAVNGSRQLDIHALAAHPAAAHFAPYIVRDSFRMCGVDGRSAMEESRIAEVGRALGLADSQIEAIRAVVESHDTNIRLWQSLIPR